MSLRSCAVWVWHPVRAIRRRRAAFAGLTALEQRRVRARRAVVRRRRGSAAGLVLGALALVVGLPVLLWQGPHWFDGKYLDDTELRKGSAALVTGLRTSLVALVAALGAGIALLYTARTYRLARRGQITDRFTKALERLGSPEVYVRIGGVLALEQIVQDAPEQAATDAARVLGHFIRAQAPKARPAPNAPGITGGPAGSVGPAQEPLPDRPAGDVQAALTALTRPESRTHVDAREQLDLEGLHLAGADLRFADLTRANLAGTTLTKAHLMVTTLTDALLLGATLTGADLRGAKLTGAILVDATLTGADLRGAKLMATNLAAATLTGADLRGLTLEETDLVGATLAEACGLRMEHVLAAHVSKETVLPARFYPSVGQSVPEEGE